jgi:hypothetical protein
VVVFDASGAVIPSVPVELDFLGSFQTASAAAGALVPLNAWMVKADQLLGAVRAVSTHFEPGYARQPVMAFPSIAYAQSAFDDLIGTFRSGGVIDIRGSATGNNAVRMRTVTNPEVRDSLMLYNPDPAPNCHWYFSSHPDGLSSLSMQVGNEVAVTLNPTCLVGTYSITPNVDSASVDPPPIHVSRYHAYPTTFYVNADEAGTALLKFSVDYTKVAPSGPVPPFHASEDLPPILVTVAPIPSCSWRLEPPTTNLGWPTVKVGERVQVTLGGYCDPGVFISRGSYPTFDYPHFTWAPNASSTGAVTLGATDQESLSLTGTRAGPVTITVHVAWTDTDGCCRVRPRQQDVQVNLNVVP